MPTTSRLTALLLLVTVGSLLLGAPAFALPSAHATHPAGCHDPMPASPAPVSHQCCVAGHQAAMPSAAFSPRPPAAQFAAACDHNVISVASLPVQPFVLPLISSGSPPNAAPLRI
ncbi:MAG TPA: hypothetical protein VKA07_15645 [Candidatus Sulfotelmatobacter sp.]|nr:hypothetical protein [Candidatus Sulfotelmatobacter sp.]